MSKRIIELIDRLDLRAEEFRLELGAERHFSRNLQRDLDRALDERDEARRERDELRQQLEDRKPPVTCAICYHSFEWSGDSCPHCQIKELRQQLEACNARDKYQPGGLNPSEVIADAMGRQSKKRFYKAWNAGELHRCATKEDKEADYEKRWTVECQVCSYSRRYLSYDMATLMKDAHEAGREPEWHASGAKVAARKWLSIHGYRVLKGLAEEFVKLTDDNAGLILAAFPEQVDSIGTGSSQGVSVGGPSSIEVPFYVFGTWLRVESDHLTPATDEETERLNDDNV